ncbi:GTPase regulator [Escherichia phage EJP2]|nr:GTPase regulator [Escherichia phage EJP2]
MLPFARILEYGNKLPTSPIETIYMPSGNSGCLFILYKDNTLYGIGGGTSRNYCFGQGDSGGTNYPNWVLVHHDVKRFACSLVEFALIQTIDNKFYYTGANDIVAGTGFSTTWTDITTLFTSVFTPTQIDSIIDIQVSWSHILVHLENGDLYGMGRNLGGTLGLGSNTMVSTFTKLNTDVKKLTHRINTTWIIKNDNSLWRTGQNSSGILGITATTNNIYSWTKYNLATNLIPHDVAMNTDGSFILINNTTTDAWYLIVSGNSINGNLGTGSLSNAVSINNNLLFLTDSSTVITSPVTLNTNGDGSDIGCVISTNGTLYTTGNGTYGRFGNGTNSNKARFTPPVNPPNISSMETYVGADFGVAYLTKAGDVYYTGRSFSNNTIQNTYQLVTPPVPKP